MTDTEILGFDPTILFSEKEPQTKTYAGNSNIYKTKPAESKSEDGIYRSKIKVIDNPFDRTKSFFNQQSYDLFDTQGWFNVISSLTLDDKSCPIYKAWQKCFFARKKNKVTGEYYFDSDEDKKLWLQAAKESEGGLSLFALRKAKYCIIQVLEDENQPELVGKYMLWKIPASILSLIEQKSKPTDVKKCAIPVTDYLYGKAIDLEVLPGPDDPQQPSRKTREIEYRGEFTEDIEPCVNPDGSPLLTSDEQDVLDAFISELKKIWREKDPDTRKDMKSELLKSEAAIALTPIYKRVMEQIKGWVPSFDIVSYSEWNDDVKARVQNWIDIVLKGENPKTTTLAPTAVENVAPVAQTAPTSSVTVETPATPDETSDLPF